MCREGAFFGRKNRFGLRDEKFPWRSAPSKPSFLGDLPLSTPSTSIYSWPLELGCYSCHLSQHLSQKHWKFHCITETQTFHFGKKLYKSPVVFPGLNLESKSHGATIPSKASTQCIPFRVHFAIACTILMTCERLITLSDSCNYNIKTCWAARMGSVESKNPYSHRKGLKFVDAPRLTLMRSNKTIDRYKRFILWCCNNNLLGGYQFILAWGVACLDRDPPRNSKLFWCWFKAAVAHVPI